MAAFDSITPISASVQQNLDGINETIDSTNDELNTIYNRLEDKLTKLQDPKVLGREQLTAEVKSLLSRANKLVTDTAKRATAKTQEITSNVADQQDKIGVLKDVADTLNGDMSSIGKLASALKKIGDLLGVTQAPTLTADASLAATKAATGGVQIVNKCSNMQKKLSVITAAAARVGISI